MLASGGRLFNIIIVLFKSLPLKFNMFIIVMEIWSQSQDTKISVTAVENLHFITISSWCKAYSYGSYEL